MTVPSDLRAKAERTWDHRQLVAARNRLDMAHRHVRLAVERLDSGNTEAALRTLFAIRDCESALVELRRFARRKGETP